MNGGAERNIGAGVGIERGRRKCAGCGKMSSGIFFCWYEPAGRYPPARRSLCAKCAPAIFKELYNESELVSRVGEESYVLGRSL